MAEKKVATVQHFYGHYAKMLGYTKLHPVWLVLAIGSRNSFGAEYYFLKVWKVALAAYHHHTGFPRGNYVR
ncbi:MULTISPECIES: hypothetical protein [unclassified Pseudoalteromonas]|uniref:hypothetical protein n=1 Tax=unclassified Pseudoalteromonas TaxID=194690 RepID=UPI0030150526